MRVTTILPFVVSMLLVWIATRVVMPALGGDPLLAWLIAGAGVIFLPILLMGLVLRGGQPLRFVAMNAQAWKWTGLGLLAVSLGSGLIAAALMGAGIAVNPPFLRMEKLPPERLWLLWAWAPFFVLNVASEELTWRGVLLPRQEVLFGRRAWLVNAGCWALMHIPFGWPVLLTTVPTLLVVPWVAQRTRNSWPGVILHALLNGPAFLILALK